MSARAAKGPFGTFGLSLATEPMEARSADTLPGGRGMWQYEPKWDGFRCLAFKERNHVELRAKSGKPLGRYFPEVLEVLAALPAERFVIDGELVIDLDGVLSFEALQMRLHPAESRIRKLAAATPARLVAFDMLLTPQGDNLLGAPLSERRRRLESFIRGMGTVNGLTLSPRTLQLTEAQAWLSRAGQGSTDGVVAKELGGTYATGERAMVKVKRLRTADCVVGGFRYESDSREVGSLLLGLYNDQGLLDHVGFTSTITDAERPALTRQLEALREPPGFTGNAPGGPSRWSTERTGQWEPVRPELVVEVRFDHVTANRFRHGTKLLRWRPDKAPRQCTFEQLAV
ncbi:MAG TPA: ATP-dependent DNA ligase [Arsenicitalea sp.]|jgi:ATP-dependent DNA ligase|nr:ATP-dependent DNA ligase [Arsenicitalea sp.]